MCAAAAAAVDAWEVATPLGAHLYDCCLCGGAPIFFFFSGWWGAGDVVDIVGDFFVGNIDKYGWL